MDLCSSTEPFSHPSIRAARAVIDSKHWALFTHPFTAEFCIVSQIIMQFLPVFTPSVLAAPESSDLYTHCYAVILGKSRAGKQENQ